MTTDRFYLDTLNMLRSPASVDMTSDCKAMLPTPEQSELRRAYFKDARERMAEVVGRHQ